MERVYKNSNQLIELHGIPYYMHDMVDACIKGKLNLFLQGDTGSGKTQQERETPRAPEPPSQTPAPTPLPYKHIIPPDPDLHEKIPPPKDYSKLLKKFELNKKINKPYSEKISLDKIIEKYYT